MEKNIILNNQEAFCFDISESIKPQTNSFNLKCRNGYEITHVEIVGNDIIIEVEPEENNNGQ